MTSSIKRAQIAHLAERDPFAPEMAWFCLWWHGLNVKDATIGTKYRPRIRIGGTR